MATKTMVVQEQGLHETARAMAEAGTAEQAGWGEEEPKETLRQRAGRWRGWAGEMEGASQDEVGAEPGPAMEEGRIVGVSVMCGPQVIRLAEEDEEQVSIIAAIGRAIAGVKEEGPHQGGLVGIFESEFAGALAPSVSVTDPYVCLGCIG